MVTSSFGREDNAGDEAKEQRPAQFSYDRSGKRADVLGRDLVDWSHGAERRGGGVEA